MSCNRLHRRHSLQFFFSSLARKFDLKGSTVDREASDKELDKSLPTFKDNDFIKQGIKISIGNDAKLKLNETLTADVGVSRTAFHRPTSAHVVHCRFSSSQNST